MSLLNKRIKRKRRVVLLLLIALLLQGVLANVSSNILWGYHSISNSDEYRHIARARQIYYHNIGFNKLWDNPSYYSLYPAGFHLLIASFMEISEDSDAFDINLIFLVIFSLTISITIFMTGNKISKWVGLLSMFFYNTFFYVSTVVGEIGKVSYKNPYPHLVSYQTYLTTHTLTYLLVFMSIFFYILILGNKIKKEYYILFELVLITHGVSHITTFIGYIANFGTLFFMMFLIFLIKHKTTFAVKHAILLALSFLSVALTYLIYYLPMYPSILGTRYDISTYLFKFFPKDFVYNMSFFILSISIISLSSLFIIGVLFKKRTALHGLKDQNLLYMFLNKKVTRYFLIGYIILYILLICAVTKNPQKYNFSGFKILNSIFPNYIPHTYGFVSAISISIGFFMFLLSALALFFIFYSYKTSLRIFGIMYSLFFVVWLSFVFLHYFPDRIIYLQYILPFIYASGIYVIVGKRGKNKKFILFRKTLIIGLILLIILSVNITIQASRDAAIRESINVTNPFRLGVTNPPTVTWSLCVATSFYTEKNEYVLASIQTGEALSATTHIHPPTFQYTIYISKHKNWNIRDSAYYGNGYAQKEFFEKYVARYLVIGNIDVTTGGEYPGKLAPIKKYNNSSHLLLIYAKGNGERIYLWVN